MGSVAANNTRVNTADTNTSWVNLGGGGPSPASEPQLKYQGTGAVNRKVTSTGGTLTGVAYDPGAGALDMTAAANRLWIAKMYVADFGDLNTTWGVELRIGSASTAYYSYNVAGTGAHRAVFTNYPSQGGYLILALDPNIAAWREATGGAPALTAVDYFGAAASFVAGGAKSENVALDAIDVGTGLTLTGASSVFQDFVDADQGTVGNRWGYVLSVGGVITARGMLTIGSATSTQFADSAAVVVFPDGYHSAGLFGVTCDLQNAGTTVDMGATLIGRGSATTEDTRPDFIVTGTAGTLSIDGTLTNFRNVTLTSACTLDGASVDCQLLTQATAGIVNSEIVTNTLASVACLQDPTFGTTSGLRDTDFIQGGAGHAIELSAAGTYNMQGLTFTGYGANIAANSALNVTAATGTVTINISGGGDTPTYNTAGATVVINNTVTVRVTVNDAATSLPIENARVYLEADAGGDLPVGTVILTGLTNASGVVEDAGFNYTSDQPVTGKVRKGSVAPLYKTSPIGGSITSTGFSSTVFMVADE